MDDSIKQKLWWISKTSDGYEDVWSSFQKIDESVLPVQMSDFQYNVDQNRITLVWNTSTELSNYGFEIARKYATNEWEDIGFVTGGGVSNTTQRYIFTDYFRGHWSDLSYRLRQVDTDGKMTVLKIIKIPQVIGSTRLILSSNYPNPFNSSTKIVFSLPQSGEVDLKVYDALGSKVDDIYYRIWMPAGYHEVSWSPKFLSSGVYFGQLRFNGVTISQKYLFQK